MSGRIILTSAGILLALGVAAGAAGAHALRPLLSPSEMATYGTAVDYHLLNALGLLGMGAVARQIESTALRWAAALVGAGVVLFSGSLYLLAFGAPRALAFVAPFGGAAMIAGWLAFAFAAWSRLRS